MPSSLAVRPLLIPAARNNADCDATRMSAARLRQKPPPMAGPPTAAITGWCILRSASTRENDDARVVVDADLLDSLAERNHDVERHGVHALGPVERDQRDVRARL